MCERKKVLRCAVVGMGRIAWSFHLPQICAQDGFQLAAVVDPDEGRLAEAKEKFNPEQCFTDFSTMLETVKPDLTVIASPTIFHKDQTIAALRSGSDVFCDKPVALNLTEAAAMYDEAKKLGRKLMSYQPHRINSETLTVKSILESGKLGKLYMIERHISNYARRSDWQAYIENGGGMLLNYGSHYIDQLLYITSGKTAKVKCELRSVITGGNADDVVKAFITTDNGVLLDLDINQAVTCPLPMWRLCGTYGTAIYQDEKWRIKYCDPATLPPMTASRHLAAAGRRYPSEAIAWQEEEVASIPYTPGTYYGFCYDYFAGDAQPFVKPEETLEVVRTIGICREDAGK